MGIAKEALVTFFDTTKKHKVVSVGGIIFAGLIIGGVIDHNCNPREEDFVEEDEHESSENIKGEDTGLIPLEEGMNAILLPTV